VRPNVCFLRIWNVYRPLQRLFVHPNNQPFSRDYLVRCLRLCLTHQGITGHYSSHSFIRGAATSARLAGPTDHEIQLLGCWQSDAYKRYVEVHHNQLLAISRKLQANGVGPRAATAHLKTRAAAQARRPKCPSGTSRIGSRCSSRLLQLFYSTRGYGSRLGGVWEEFSPAEP
jgi:hypothetical protein